MPLPSVFQGVQDCRLPGLKPSKPFRRPPRQQLLQLHGPSAGLQEATTLTATCPCRLFFKGFKTAVCPASNPSVFQEVQDCRLPGLKRSKPFRRPPRQQLLQLDAPAICFSGDSRVQDCRLPGLKPSKPFRRPPRQQLFQPHAPAICFSGGSRLPSARPQTLQTFRRPPRQQLLQLHAPAICFSGGSRLPFARPQTLQTLPQASKATTLTATWPFRRPPRQQLVLQLHAPAVCFSRGSRLPFARPQTHLFFRGFKTAVCPASNAPNLRRHCRQTLPQASKATTLTARCPCHLFFRGFKSSRLPFARPQTLQTLPQASKATTLTATCPCHLFFRGFKTAVCPASIAPNASAGLQGNNSYSYMPLPSVFQRVQDCRLPGLKPSKPFRRPPRQQLLQLDAPAICFSGVQEFKTAVCPASNPPNPSAGLQGNNSYSYMALPQAAKATTLTATCPCRLFFKGFKTAVCPASNPSVFQGVQDCRLPGLKRSKPFRRPPRQQLLQLDAPAICFSGGSRVQDCRLPGLKPSKPFRRPPRQQLLQLDAPAICFSGVQEFKTAVCPASNPPNPSAGLQGNNSYSYMALAQASKATTLTATCPCRLFFKGSKTAVCPASNPSVFQGVQDFRLPGLKRSKPLQALPFARPQTLQTLPQASKATTLTARCPCHLFFRGFKSSRLPFARPQTLQTLPQASKATTLTARCPCHLFFSGFKAAVCPASNPPNPSAGLQGNNSYSYMPLPSVFQRVQDCRLPGLKPSKPFRRPPRQQLLQLHAPAICFSAGSRLPFARPQTLQTLPQASKATTLTATCPCHLFFSGFKTAVCPASNPPNPSAGLQEATTLTATCPCHVFFRGFKSSRLPFARPQTLQTLPQAYKATTLTARWPCHLFFRGFKSSRLPFARPQTLQNLPEASKATTLTAILYTGRSIGKERSTWSQLSRTEPSFTRKSGT